MDSRDQQITDLERELHRLRVALQQAEARARTWRRVAQWIHDAQTDSDSSPAPPL